MAATNITEVLEQGIELAKNDRYLSPLSRVERQRNIYKMLYHGKRRDCRALERKIQNLEARNARLNATINKILERCNVN